MSENKNVAEAAVDETPSVQETETKLAKDSGTVVEQDGVYKVDLTKKPDQNAVQEQSTDEVPVRDEPEASEKVVEKVQEQEEPTGESQEEKTIELVNEESVEEKTEPTEQKVEEKIPEPQVQLPPGVDKLVSFLQETGGSMEDYVRLNQDFDSYDDSTLISEYYKQTKPHLNMEEINFLLEDKFSYNEDEDDPINIKRKKLAYKEEIASARNYLSSQKNKYYEDIKSGANASPEVKEALGFYNNYKKEQEELTVRQQKLAEHFKNKTNNLFNDNFKGFDFKVGENKYRFNVKDVQSTKEVQSDILKTFKTFLDKDNMLNDAKGYHKALFAARNADSIASHFYEQGKADAIKQISAESKNINMDPRRAAQNNETTGFKVRALSGDDSSKLKVKIRKSI
jgi:hypothetical protein|tara:strand:- start:1092 stop:2282 length:1191 start_codon:yes stop_codon:yes gene_type:complete